MTATATTKTNSATTATTTTLQGAKTKTKVKAKAKAPEAFTSMGCGTTCTWERMVNSGVTLVVSDLDDASLLLVLDDENHDLKGIVQSVGSQLADKGAKAPVIGGFKALVSAMGKARRHADTKVDVYGTNRQRSVGTVHVVACPIDVPVVNGEPTNRGIEMIADLCDMFDGALDKKDKKTRRSAQRGKAILSGSRARHSFRKAGGTDEQFNKGTTRYADDKARRESQVAKIKAGAAF